MSSQSAAKLRSRYVEQVASDLTENRRRQEELAKRIELLKQEENLLTDMLNLAERYEGFADASRLPEQAQEEPEVAKAKRRSANGATAAADAASGTRSSASQASEATSPASVKAPKTTAKATGKTTAKSAGKSISKSGDKKTAPKSGTRSAAKSSTKTVKSSAQPISRQPLLGEVLLELLAAYTEPRLAKELRDELLEKHPSRNPTPQVVRNTLESLVAKGRIQRHKQQRSVMYTVVQPTGVVQPKDVRPQGVAESADAG
ncbi:hypothetical protein [Streptomyces sp. NPDC087300]|uniref:hypothetical protein n=1 Tax=Streptomyces sp. NPDC087300 TaxID=3365780 RepID=UPI003814AC61